MVDATFAVSSCYNTTVRVGFPLYPRHPAGLSRSSVVCRKVEEQLANLECNATSAVRISHFFLSRMVRHGVQLWHLICQLLFN